MVEQERIRQVTFQMRLPVQQFGLTKAQRRACKDPDTQIGIFPQVKNIRVAEERNSQFRGRAVQIS